MLQSIRNKAGSWFAMVILFLVLISMLFFGIGDYFTTRSETFVAKVGDEEIDQAEFKERFGRWRENMRQQMGGNADPRMLDQPGFRRQILDSMIDQAVLRQANERLGLVVPASRLRAEIAAIPAFQVNGQFDEQTYRSILSRQGLSPAAFQLDMNKSLAAEIIPSAVAGSVPLTDAELDAYLRLSEQTRDFRFVRVTEPAAAVSTDIPQQELQAYYDSNGSDFMTPETVTIEYVEVDAAGLTIPVQPSEQDLEARYESEKKRFGTPEQRLASHILVRAEGDDADAQKAALAQAEQLVAQARADGADFAVLAKEHTADIGTREQGGDLGWIERGMMDPAFEDALFELETDAVSDPVRSDEGYHVITLRELRAATQKPLEEVREQLITEYLESERERLYNDRTSELVDLVYENPDSLAPVAQALGLEIKTVGPFDRSSSEGLFANAAVREAAFSDEVLLENIVKEVDLGGNHMIALRMTEHAKSEPRPIVNVTEEMRGRILAQRRTDAIKARADALFERLSKGESLAAIARELGSEAENAESIARTAAVPEQALVAASFKLPRPGGDGPVRRLVALSEGHALVELVKVVDGDPTKVEQARRDQVRTELEQSRARAEAQGLIAALRATTEIVVAEDRLQ